MDNKSSYTWYNASNMDVWNIHVFNVHINDNRINQKEKRMIKYYWEALFESTTPFMLAWEAYVLFILCFFISIAWRLNRMEKKMDYINERLDLIIDILEE